MYAPSTVRFRPITREEDSCSEFEVKILAAWKKQRHNPCVDTVIQTLNQILLAEQQEPSDSQFA